MVLTKRKTLIASTAPVLQYFATTINFVLDSLLILKKFKRIVIKYKAESIDCQFLK